jgi:uncharacterized membrane protein (DUF485 family)
MGGIVPEEIMSFREKSAWIMTVSLLVGGACYFYLVAQASAAAGTLAPPLLPALLGYVIALVVIAVVGHVLVAVLAVRDTAAPADERDRAIIDRAAHLAGYVLGTGALLALSGYLFTYQGHLLFYGVLASLMVAQTVEYVAQIYLYRRGV